MTSSWLSGSARTLLIAGGMTIGLAAAPHPRLHAQSTSGSPAELVREADGAEAAYEFDVAIDRLYAVLIEHPSTPEAADGRVRLTRLLTLAGDLPAAILQCQALRDTLPASDPRRQAAMELATGLARRLRGRRGAALYPVSEILAPRGLGNLQNPTQLLRDPSAEWLLTDQEARRIYRIASDAAQPVSGAAEATAASPLPDGAIVVAAKTGLVAIPPGRPVPATALWGGRARQMRRIRAVAANSRGDLFVIDREFEGLLRCNVGASQCVPWADQGSLRTVKIGPSDLIVTLGDRRQGVRVLDDAGRVLATIGPTIGAVRLDEVNDIAVDAAYALYLLEGEARRIHILALRLGATKGFTADLIGSVAVPEEGERALRNPSTIGVTASGTMVVAGRSSARLLRFR